MRTLLPIVLLLLPRCVLGGMEGERFESPSRQYCIWNLGDSARAEAYFELRTARGDVLFSPNEDAKDSLALGRPFSNSYADDVMWSPDEQFVLFTFYDGKYKVTAVYSFAARALISLGHVIDGWTVPIRWLDTRRFIVEHHWPMGGKARPQSRYRETYVVRANPFSLRRTYKSPTIRGKDEDDDT